MRFKSEPSGELDIKRFQLRGVEAETTCPQCQSAVRADMTDRINYPSIGRNEEVFGWYCRWCDAEWTEPYTLTIAVTLEAT